MSTAPGVASAPVKPDVASKFMRALRDQYIDGGMLSQFQDLAGIFRLEYPGQSPWHPCRTFYILFKMDPVL